MFSPYYLHIIFPFVLIASIFAIFFGRRKLRYSLMPADVGMKAAPLGCMASAFLLFVISLLPSIIFENPLSFFVVGAFGITIVCIMTNFFFKKAKAWQEAHPGEENLSLPEYQAKPRFGFGIFLYILGALVTIPLSSFILCIWVIPFLCVQCHLNYDEPVEIPLQHLPCMESSVLLTEYPIGFMPGNESAFILIIDDKKGNEIRFPDFLINCGSHYEVAIYHICGKSTTDSGWLQFYNVGGSKAYLQLNSLKITDELPDELQNDPRQFIGIYEGGKLDTNAKDPARK